MCDEIDQKICETVEKENCIHTMLPTPLKKQTKITYMTCTNKAPVMNRRRMFPIRTEISTYKIRKRCLFFKLLD